MVVRGFVQVHNVDFYETFAPTPSAASVKIAVAVVNEKGWLLWHIDMIEVIEVTTKCILITGKA